MYPMHFFQSAGQRVEVHTHKVLPKCCALTLTYFPRGLLLCEFTRMRQQRESEISNVASGKSLWVLRHRTDTCRSRSLCTQHNNARWCRASGRH